MTLIDEDLSIDTGPGEGLPALRKPHAPNGEDTSPDMEQFDMLLRWADVRQTPNIAEDLSDGTLSTIGMRVIEEFEIDNASRREWLDKAKTAIELATQVTQPSTTPWEGSSNIIYPLIGMASIQFSARAYPAIIAGADVVKGVVVGKDDGTPQTDQKTGQPVIDPQTQKPQWQIEPGAKRKRADRIGQHMSWQLTEEQSECEEETDKLLTVLPIIGCEFRKTYFDPGEGRNTSVRVSAENLVVNYRAKSMETAPRLTEILRLYPIEIE